MTIKAEMFKNHAITRDLVLLDTACFNHLFNNKRWFIKYKDINLVAVRASNGGQGATIGKGIVRLVMLLLDGLEHILELPNIMYQPATPCNLISAGQLERNAVIQDRFTKTICFKDSRQVLRQYTTIDLVFAMVLSPKTNATTTNLAFSTTKIKTKVNYRIIHRRLLYYGHDKLMAVAKELGITYTPVEYANFDCKACHKSKDKIQISRQKLVPVQTPL
jgi:hypothetical protein